MAAKKPSTPASAPASVAPARNRRLGRGLASLMSNTRLTPPAQASAVADAPPPAPARYEPASPAPEPPQPDDTLLQLSPDEIRPNPHQPRKTFDEAELAELADSIRQQGLLQPLVVVPNPQNGQGGYVLIAGERRLRASKLAGLERVPCVLRTATRQQMLEWALVENVQRADLNPVERAQAYRDYLDRFGATQQQLAERLGQPRSTVANFLRILDLCDDAQALILSGQLSFGHAKVLASLAGQPARQAELARQAAEQGLSVRQLEALLGQAPPEPPAQPETPPSAKSKTQYVQDLERQLTRSIGTKVVIQPGRKKNAGRILLEYYSIEDFERITEALGARIES